MRIDRLLTLTLALLFSPSISSAWAQASAAASPLSACGSDDTAFDVSRGKLSKEARLASAPCRSISSRSPTTKADSC